MSHHDYVANTEFLSLLKSEAWRKKPTVFRQPFKRPIASEREVFDGAVRWADRWQSEDTLDYQFYLENGSLRAEIESWFPLAQDASCQGYLDRISPRLGHRSFGILANNFNIDLGWESWNRFRAFLGSIYPVTGVPNMVELLLFLGNYKITPNGVHRDSADVFCFITERSKQMRLWPFEVFAGRKAKIGMINYEKHLDQSILLEGEVGDVFYWPSSYWHVGESDGTIGSSLTLALYFQGSPLDSLGKQIQSEVINSKLHKKLQTTDKFHRSKVPSKWLDYSRELGGELDRIEFQQWLLRKLMDRTTAHGFHHTPQYTPTDGLDKSDKVQIDPLFPILSARQKGKTIISANGHSFALRSSPSIESVLKKLNTGKPYAVEALCKQIGAAGSFQFLELLHNLDAIRKASV